MLDKYLDSRTWERKKEKRKHYRKSKAWDRTCRNHGSCEYCEQNRLFKNKREESKYPLDQELITQDDIKKEIEQEEFEMQFDYYKGYWVDYIRRIH